MLSWRRAFTLVIVLVAIVLAGCAPASPSVDKAASELAAYAESSSRFALKLPRVYVQYDNNGVLGVAGITTNDLYRWFGVDLRMMNLQPWVVQALVRANVQHIEITESADGLAIYVNGEPLPYIAWDSESLANLGQVLPAFGVPYGEIVGKLLPLIRFTQMSLVVQFPVAPGAEFIPFRDPDAPPVVAARAEMVEKPPAVVRLEIAYDEEGMPSILGIDARTLLALGVDVRPLALNKGLIRSLMQANIQHVHFVNRPDGIYIFVNNKPLPYLAWDDAHVNTALDLYARMSGLGNSPVLRLLTQILPMMRASDIDVLLRFPVPEGAQPIPVLEAPAQ